ncbi:MAG TPA: ABC transporter permease subunit [Thermomicrobiales bacterium]|nr:ABC transporter permease subunit [Thermomicrobiales bacterium]
MATATADAATAAARPPRGEGSPIAVQVRGVLAKELRGRMRGPRAFIVLSVYMLLLSGFTLLIYGLVKLAATSTPTIPAGKIVFLGLVAFQLGLVCFLAPSFTAGVISGERERQTYDLLMTTPLPLPLVVGAKLLAALAYVLLLIVAALPLMSIAVFLGGVAPVEAGIALVLLLASALVCGTVGLCFSAWVRSTIGAAALAYGTMMLPVFALPIVFGIVASFAGAIVSSAGSSAGLVWVYYIAGFIYCLNPFIAGGATEFIIAADKSVLFFSTSVPTGTGSVTVYVPGPWLIYTVMALLVAAVFFALALYFARPTRQVGRKRAGR